jgi:hypothetical protein
MPWFWFWFLGWWQAPESNEAAQNEAASANQVLPRLLASRHQQSYMDTRYGNQSTGNSTNETGGLLLPGMIFPIVFLTLVVAALLHLI